MVTEPTKNLATADLFCFMSTSATGLCFSTKLQMAAPMALLPSGSECSMVAVTVAPASDAFGMKNLRCFHLRSTTAL